MRKMCVLAVLGISGCVVTSGFDRGELHMALDKEGVQITEDTVRKALELRPQLHFPCKVAIYLHDPGSNYEWRWSAKDKEIILSWMEGLRREGIVADAFFMTGMFTSGSTMKEVRLAAAQHGADAVLVVKGAYQTDSYMNPAAILNVTILGGYILPASHRDALFIMQGGLVDVANGYLYATVESEGQASIMRPTFTIQDKDAVEPAKKKAIESLGPELTRRLRNLRGYPFTSARPSTSARLERPQLDLSVTPAKQ